MAPMHGARVIGQKAYDKQLAEEAAQAATHGGDKAMYGSRILSGAPAATDDALAAPLTIAQLEEQLSTTPDALDALAAAELAREQPRKGALVLLLAASKAREDSEDLTAQLREALGQGAEG